jgi:hypothetical protein
MINLATNTIGATRKAGGAGPSPFDPSSLTGLIGWWRADQGVTLNSGYVSEWAPIAGTASPLSQPNAGKQPNYDAVGAINGQPTIFHDTNGQGLSMDAPAKLMDYANTDDFFVLMVETMELSSSANTGIRDSFDIVGWAGSPAAGAYHARSKTLVTHSMGLIGAAAQPSQSMTSLFSPTLAAGDPHWWAYGARRGRRVELSKNIAGGSAGTAAEISIPFDATSVNVGGFTVVSNVITIPTTGKYTIGATAVFVNVVATGNASLGLKVNGGAYTAYSANTAVSGTTARAFTKTLNLNAGDTIEIFSVWDGTITTRDWVPAPGAINARIQCYDYYTMDGGITPYSLTDNPSVNSLPGSNTVTSTYTLKAATGGGATTGATFSYTPIGYIAELIVCNQIPDAATFTQLNNYLYSRYALGSNI